MQELTTEYELCLRRIAAVGEVNVDRLISESEGRPRDVFGSRDLRTSNRLNNLKIQLRKAIMETMPRSPHCDVLTFRQTLEQRWGIEQKLNALLESLEELEGAIQTRSEVRTNRLINNLTLFGFPAVMFAGFFGFVLTEDFPVDIHWLGIAIYITLSIAGAGLLIHFLSKGERDR